MAKIDTSSLARDLSAAYASRHTTLTPPSARPEGLDLASAYAVERAYQTLRQDDGHHVVGRKVGYANKAMWRALKLETLVWAHMYDDTVQSADRNVAALAIDRMCAPKIEPEIVFKLKSPLDGAVTDPAAVLEAVEWLALGFEIIDCPFVDWKFQPVDFVAAFGLHAALVVGDPRPVTPARIPALVDELATFTVQLRKDGEVVAEGAGKNSLRSPALCLGELASAIARQPGASPLVAGELISSGTLTESMRLTSGSVWSATVSGLDVPDLSLRV